MNRSRACGRIGTSMNNRPDAVILDVIQLEENESPIIYSCHCCNWNRNILPDIPAVMVALNTFSNFCFYVLLLSYFLFSFKQLNAEFCYWICCDGAVIVYS